MRPVRPSPNTVRPKPIGTISGLSMSISGMINITKIGKSMNMTPTPAQRNGIRSSAEAVSVADSIDSLKSSRASEASEPASLMRSRAVSEDTRRRRGELVGEGMLRIMAPRGMMHREGFVLMLREMMFSSGRATFKISQIPRFRLRHPPPPPHLRQTRWRPHLLPRPARPPRACARPAPPPPRPA